MADASESMLSVEVWRGAEKGAFQTFQVPRRAHQTILDVVTEIQRVQDAGAEAVFSQRLGPRMETLQRAMALMAQHLAAQNNQILRHIAMRREKGQQPSPAIEAASQRVAEILFTLSEVSFGTHGADGESVDLIEELERRLQERDSVPESL